MTTGGNGATGVHSGVAGGDPNSGSASERGDVAEPAGPLLSAVQQARLQSIGRLISEAQKDLRAGKVDENLLKSLGMTREQYAAFVEAYAQRIGKVEKMRPATSRPTGSLGGAFSLSGSDRRQQGRGLDGTVENVQGGEKLSPDEIRRLYEDRAKKVSPEFRRPVEAYFRAVSEGAAASPPPAAAGK